MVGLNGKFWHSSDGLTPCLCIQRKAEYGDAKVSVGPGRRTLWKYAQSSRYMLDPYPQGHAPLKNRAEARPLSIINM